MVPCRTCSGEPRPAEPTAAAETRALLARLLEELPEQQRTVLVLRDLTGIPTEAVAETLGTTSSTVRVHLARARRKLREAYARNAAKEKMP